MAAHLVEEASPYPQVGVQLEVMEDEEVSVAGLMLMA
jgi:hypothetical protein